MKVVSIKNMLYVPLSVAKELGYSILDEWVEEVYNGFDLY